MPKNKKIYLIFCLFLLSLNFLLLEEIFAQETKETILAQSVKRVYERAIQIAGIFAFLSLVFGGFLYLISAGDPSKTRGAREQILASFLGLLILLGSWSILKTISPKLVEFEVKPLEPEKKEEYQEFKLPQITSGLYGELAVETRIKGVEEKEFGIFNPDRLERMKELVIDINTAASGSKILAKELKDLANQCKCENPCGTSRGPNCVRPECRGVCQKIEGEGEKEKEECRDLGCNGICTSDPCCEVRNKIDKNKEKNRENIKEFQDLQKKLDKERLDLESEINKLIKTLKIMKDECFLSNVISRDNYVSLSNYYRLHEWELKKFSYFDDIDELLLHSFADFYCPVGGTRAGQIPEIKFFEKKEEETEARELTEKEIKERLKGFSETFEEEYVKRAGKFETKTSCPTPIPFGEIIDRILAMAKKLAEKLKEMNRLQEEIIGAIDELHQAVSKCTSKNCRAVCGCSCCGAICSCTGCNCDGSACPFGEINARVEKINESRKKIAQKKIEIEGFVELREKWDEIRKLVGKETADEKIIGTIKKYLDENWLAKLEKQFGKEWTELNLKDFTQNYINGELKDFLQVIIEFEKMAWRIHYCLTVSPEIEAGWFLRDCFRTMGAIGPDGKIFEAEINKEGEVTKMEAEQCLCKNYQKKCKEDFPKLLQYNCQVLGHGNLENYPCENYNYFCCQIKD